MSAVSQWRPWMPDTLRDEPAKLDVAAKQPGLRHAGRSRLRLNIH
jgi:hypothetical protein